MIFFDINVTDSTIAAASVGSALGNIKLEQLDEQGRLISQVNQARAQVFDWGTIINSVTSDLKSAINNSINQAAAKLVARKILKATEVTGLALATYKSFQILYKWNFAAAAQPPPPQTPNSGPSSTATTSSTSSSSASPAATQYSIVTRRGTTVTQFEAFIKSLPDAGQGDKCVFENLDSQEYGTFLNASDVAEIQENPIVQSIEENTSLADEFPDGDDGYSIIPRHKEKYSEDDMQINRVRQDGAPIHLNIISQGPNNARARVGGGDNPPIPDYTLSDKAGEGITIYVLDSGIDPGHPVCFLSLP